MSRGGGIMPETDPNPGNQDWRGGLPEEIRGEKSLEVIKGKDWSEAGPVLAKSYVEAQKMIGGSVRIPKEDAPPEEWQKFHQKLGTPEKPEGYQFNRPALGEGAAWDSAFEKKFLATAHGLGLNNKGVQKLMDLQAELVETQLKDIARKRQETVETLKKEWGGDYERKLSLAGRAKMLLQAKAGISEEEADAFFDGMGAGDHPVILKIFHQLGEIFAEDGWIRGDEVPASGVEAAKAKIKEINANPKHPYWVDGPGHAEAVKEMEELHKIAYPGRRK
jgi:hypothetical protein